MQTTIWNEATYAAGLKAAMKLLMDDCALRFPGVRRVEHEYFHAVHGAGEAQRRAYLQRAYQLGLRFCPRGSRGLWSA